LTFKFMPTDLDGVVVVEPETHPDERGFFRESFRTSAFEEAGIGPFVQWNVSRSRRGVVRGIHFQREPAGIGKLVSVAHGRVLDVAVDVRPSSPTFGRWVAEELSADDGRMLFVPRGFGHGFCALDEDTVVSYLMTGTYSEEHDAGVRWDDPAIGIDWPVSEAMVSDKDRGLPTLAEFGASDGTTEGSKEANA
jgi:dTDP-4-dehydrorhamnose 3,5-epimerase